ncbi:peptidoglycan-binding protein, partial [Patescibacteria group bacterium]|nr:peptidoglycan-binding protein [Patescibacteria group bacterium]
MLKKYRKFPRLWQWERFFNVLSKSEKIFFIVCFWLVIGSLIFLNLNFYFKNTEVVPSFGGIYKEGLVGQPRFINPIYLSTQDVDRDLVEILFSGLMKYNEKGELQRDLVKDYEIKENGKIFEVWLKDNVFWHDGERLTADDVVFTINLIQDPQYQSPLRIKWLGIKAEKISANAVRFRLPKKYSGFLETLTLKIVPKHIFEDLAPQNLPWELVSEEYLIGSGPFKFKSLIQDKSGYIRELSLERNENYYDKKPYLEELSFLFYQDETEIISQARVGEIQGFSITDPKYFDGSIKENFECYLLSLPRYFAVFFNLKEKGIFSDKRVREALAFAADKNEILQNIFSGKGEVVNSPTLPDFFGFKTPAKISEFDQAEAQEILEEEGFKINPETGRREKLVAKEISPLFKRNLVSGVKGEDVRELQKCLAQDKEVYPEGEITGYFGEKTKAAVIRFQEKYAQDILTPIG